MSKRGAVRKKRDVSSAKSAKAARAPRSYGPSIGGHREAFSNALGRLFAQPFATVMTLLVIGIALAMPAGLHLLVQNARLISGEWASAVDLSVYVKPGTSDADIEALRQQVSNMDDVDNLIVVSADQAIEDFRALSGFAPALEALEDNPLPATIIVRPSAIDDDPAAMTALADELSKLPNVDLVQLDTEWVARFQGMLDVVRRAVIVAAALLALAVLVIVGNTIRVEIQQRRDEIEVTKLVGGTDGFIRRPFLYTGFWFGLLGGTLALALVTLVVQLLGAPVGRVAGLYGSDFALRGLQGLQWLYLLGGSVFLGILGSWIAATRQIRAIEPS